MNLTLSNMPVMQENIAITGIPKGDAQGFTINVGPKEGDYALNFNADFTQEKITIYTVRSGTKTNKVVLSCFPFKRGLKFQVIISFTSSEFIINLPDGNNEKYTNNFTTDEFKFIQVLGDLKIKGFNIE